MQLHTKRYLQNLTFMGPCILIIL